MNNKVPNIRSIDMEFLNDLFEMRGGYVLNFTDRTFSKFFENEVHVDIDAPKFMADGTSKAKRLRSFLQIEERSTVIAALNALWEYRTTLRRRNGELETIAHANTEFAALMSRLQGPDSGQSNRPSEPSLIDPNKIIQMKSDLIGLSELAPHPRGYAFERLLKEIFDLFGLAAREPFRLRGEQIDGSFQFGSETYLVEAKWQAECVGVAELHTFHGKIEQKAAWTRGLFISNSGFTNDGLDAFGRGKRVICMDGFDLYETLDRQIPLTKVLAGKLRRAAETGQPFVRVRDLGL